MTRLTGNILEPLTFEEGEISIFLRDNRCAICGGKFQSRPVAGRKWQAFCPICRTPVMQHNYTSIYIQEKVKQGEIDGASELRPKTKPRDPETIIKELGF